MIVASYDPDGVLTSGFGQLGVAQADLSGGDDFADKLVLDSAGRIVVVGRATSATVTDMALVRFKADGTLDTSFEGDGIVTADSQGRIVAAGSSGGFALMRVDP